MEGKPCSLIPCDDDVARSFRDMPPAHYIIKIDSFTSLQQLLSETGAKSYDSKTFEACGHKWKLSLYPKGNKERKGKGYISMYLVIQDTEALPLGWEVNVNFKLFVFDQIRGKYLTIQDAMGSVRRFDEMKNEWGFQQLMPHYIFHDASNGYLVRDKCVFGAEILVIGGSGKGEKLTCSRLKDNDGSHTWKISHFSLANEVYYSDIFTIGNYKWKLAIYPKGIASGAGNSVSIFLEIVDLETADIVDVVHKLIIQDQLGNNDKELRGRYRFTFAGEAKGFLQFTSLSDMKDTSKGFVVNDSLIVGVQFTNMSAVQSFS